MSATKTNAHLCLDLDDVRKAGGVSEALAAWCKESDTTTCGVVGQSFATSGPGNGWSKTFGRDDFASRAFEGGALYYLDTDDGKIKEALPVDGAEEVDEDDDTILTDIGGCRYREGEWSDESEVELACPTIEDALEHPAIVAEMAQAVIDHHGPCSDRAAWKRLIESIRAAAEALEDVDADELAD